MPDSTSGKLTLPEFEVGKTYLLKGETLKQICDVIKENRIVLTGTLAFKEISQEGSKLALNTVTLQVCIGGVAQTKTFVVLA